MSFKRGVTVKDSCLIFGFAVLFAACSGRRVTELETVTVFQDVRIDLTRVMVLKPAGSVGSQPSDTSKRRSPRDWYICTFLSFRDLDEPVPQGDARNFFDCSDKWHPDEGSSETNLILLSPSGPLKLWAEPGGHRLVAADGLHLLTVVREAGKPWLYHIASEAQPWLALDGGVDWQKAPDVVEMFLKEEDPIGELEIDKAIARYEDGSQRLVKAMIDADPQRVTASRDWEHAWSVLTASEKQEVLMAWVDALTDDDALWGDEPSVRKVFLSGWLVNQGLRCQQLPSAPESASFVHCQPVLGADAAGIPAFVAGPFNVPEPHYEGGMMKHLELSGVDVQELIGGSLELD